MTRYIRRLGLKPEPFLRILSNTNIESPWNCSPAASQRYQQAYLGAEVGTGVITQIAFRPKGGPFGPTSIPGVTIMLSSTSNGPSSGNRSMPRKRSPRPNSARSAARLSIEMTR